MLNTQHRGWKGRRKTTQGYIWIYEPEAFGCKTTKGLDGYIREHNLVIERFLGRSLENSDKKVNLAPVQCEKYPDRKHFMVVC